MHHQFSPRFNTSRVPEVFFYLWEKTKKRFVPWKMQAITTALGVWGFNCANRWLTAQALLGAGEVGQMSHRRAFASNWENRFSFFLWNLRALKWWLMLNCFMVRAWAKFIVLTFCLPVRHRRYTQLGLWGLSVEALAGYLVLTDTDGTRKEDLAGLIFRAGERPAHRTPWEAT